MDHWNYSNYHYIIIPIRTYTFFYEVFTNLIQF